MAIYTPAAFSPADRTIGWRIVREHPFGLLLLPGGSITPLPMLGDEASLVLRGHVARANPASRLPEGTDATAVFLGPHAYVSPTWYEKPNEQVPTWNYVFAEATGELRWLGTSETRQLLDDLCARFESPGGYSPDWVDAREMTEMLQEIVGFEIRVSRMHAKLKLSQNRTPEERARVRDHLADSPSPGPEVAAWMTSQKA